MNNKNILLFSAALLLCACGQTTTSTPATQQPTEAPAPTATWTVTSELKTGDDVLIAAPAYNKLLSAEKVSESSYYNKGVDYSADDFSNVTDAEIFDVTVNTDGTYTFTSLSGTVIALAADFASLNAEGENKSWELIAKEGSENIFYLKNAGRGNYLEWYASKGNWSTYSTSSLSDLFELSFYIKK